MISVYAPHIREILESQRTEEKKVECMDRICRTLSPHDFIDLKLETQQDIAKHQPDRVQFRTQQEIYSQVGGTCYAHAVADMIVATEMRIIGRLPNYQNILQDLIARYGTSGADVRVVLDEQCRKRQLRYQEITTGTIGCVDALRNGRCVLATFDFDAGQWTDFSNFFAHNPQGILQALNIRPRRNWYQQGSGHAVVIEGYDDDDKTWIIKNSWGLSWADGGRFKVYNDAINFTFYDVYFCVEDLTPKDLECFRTVRIEDMLIRASNIEMRANNGLAMRDSNGDFYEHDRETGNLFYVWENGDIYEGEFLTQTHSKVLYRWADGGFYDGEWTWGKLSGEGIRVWADGKKYEGFFLDGKREGTGTQTWVDGQKYTGEWVDDKMTGKGVMTWPNRERYEGDFVDGRREGKGVCTYPNGDVYSGDWANDARTGYGYFILDNGSGEWYFGDFMNNMLHGRGTSRSSNGEFYDGDFVENKRSGQGILEYPNGEKYVGAFLNGRRICRGPFYGPNGAYQGELFNNVPAIGRRVYQAPLIGVSEDTLGSVHGSHLHFSRIVYRV